MSQRKMATANYEGLKSSLNSQESKHTSYNNKKITGRTPSSKRTDELSNYTDGKKPSIANQLLTITNKRTNAPITISLPR